MYTDPVVVGAILMGGKSRRFGSDKALADIDGRPMGARIADVLRQAGLDPVVAVGGDAGGQLGLVTIPDRRPDAGPLAGLASVLGWAGRGGVVVVPCDHPTLAIADVEALIHAFRADPDRPAVGVVNDAAQVSIACWPAGLGRQVQRLLDQGEHRFRGALELLEPQLVTISEASARDADDPAGLRAALDAANEASTSSGSAIPSESVVGDHEPR